MSNGYIDAPATKMLATYCAACGRELVDAESVEIGMGPVCRKKYGYDNDVPDELRTEANKLVHEIACRQSGPDVAQFIARIWNLGYQRLATRVLKRLSALVVEEIEVDGQQRLALHTPYREEVVSAMRRVPGRQWDGEVKVNHFPMTNESKAALWDLMRVHFAGCPALGPKGVFVIAE